MASLREDMWAGAKQGFAGGTTAAIMSGGSGWAAVPLGTVAGAVGGAVRHGIDYVSGQRAPRINPATGAPQFVADGTQYPQFDTGGYDDAQSGESDDDPIDRSIVEARNAAMYERLVGTPEAPYINLPMPRILPNAESAAAQDFGLPAGVEMPRPYNEGDAIPEGWTRGGRGGRTLLPPGFEFGPTDEMLYNGQPLRSERVVAPPPPSVFNPNNPNQPIDPRAYATGPRLTGTPFSDPMGGRSFVPDMMGLSGTRSRALFDEAARLESEAGRFSLGEITNAKQQQFALARERLGRTKASRMSEAEAMLNRNRVGGSTLAISALGTVDAEFAQQERELEVAEAESVAQSRLQEIDVKNELYSRASQSRIQAVQATVEDVFKTAELGMKDQALRVQAQESRDRLLAAFAAIEGEITRTQMQIAASEAQSIRDNLTRLKIGRESNDASERINDARIGFETDKGIGQGLSGVLEPTVTQVGKSLSEWMFPSKTGSASNAGWTEVDGTYYSGGYPAAV